MNASLIVRAVSLSRVQQRLLLSLECIKEVSNCLDSEHHHDCLSLEEQTIMVDCLDATIKTVELMCFALKQRVSTMGQVGDMLYSPITIAVADLIKVEKNSINLKEKLDKATAKR